MVFVFCVSGSGKTYAYNATSGSCGVTGSNPNDFAGLVVGYGAVNSNNNPDTSVDFSSVSVRVNTIYPSYSNSDGSFNPSGTGYYNMFNSNNSGQRDSGATFYAINKGDICGMGTGWYSILGHSYQQATGDKNGNEWELDCDFSYRAEAGGPQANPSKPYQQFNVYPSGVPKGAASGGYWTATAFKWGNDTLDKTNENVQSVGGHIDASNPEQVAPANGNTAAFVLVYHEPPQCTGCGCPGVSCPPTTLTPTQTANCSTADAFNPGSEQYQSPLSSDTSGADSRFVNYSLPSPPVSWSTKNSGLVLNRTVVTVTDSSGATLVSDVIGSGRASSGGTRNGSGSLWLGDTWNYQPSGKTVYYTFDLEEYILAHNGNYYWVDYQRIANNDGPCYSATCSLNVDGNVPNGPGDGVEANSSFIVWATVTNTGGSDGNMSLPDNVGPYGFSLTSASPSYPNYIGGIPPGASESFPLTLTANGSGSYTISYYPDYWGSSPMLGFGSACSATMDVYQQFNITPTATSPTGNSENPTAVSYGYGGTNSGATVTAQTQGWLTLGSSSTVDGKYITNDSYGNVFYSKTYHPTPSQITAGNQFCSHVIVNPATGWVDSGGNIANGQSSGQIDSPQCLKVVNEPYVHVFGGDADAGGGFGVNCSVTSSGGIYTYINSTGSRPGGSGTQFGAQGARALDIIEGFASANLRGSAPTGPMGLTFANNSGVIGSPPAPTMGGRLGLSSYCLPEYYPTSTVGMFDPGGTLSGTIISQAYSHSGGNLTIGSTNPIGNGTNAAVYVTGHDVYIKNNITYAGSSSWSKVSDIPSFMLVVKGGNIYIDPGVKNLDGIYVAEPSGGHGGAINTCGNGFASYTIQNIYDNCKNRLTVNGSFVADKVFLSRSYSSLRYSQGGEYPGGAARPCSTTGNDVPAGDPGGPDCAAEIFNIDPELFMAKWQQLPNTGPTTGKFDYITSLSPVL